MSTIFFWILDTVARVVRSCTELSGTLLGRRRAPQLMDHTSGVPPPFALDVPALDDLDPVSYMLLGREVLPPYDSQDGQGDAALLPSGPAVRLGMDHTSGAPPHFAPGGPGPALGDLVPVSYMLPGSELIPPYYGSQDGQGYLPLLQQLRPPTAPTPPKGGFMNSGRDAPDAYTNFFFRDRPRDGYIHDSRWP